jgi:hypothetical protein
MTYEEREKLVDQIYEKANELKELVSQVEDQRVDFEEDENGEYCYNDIYIETPDLRIYEGSNWFHDDELLVQSIYVEDDELYFDANWTRWTSNGSVSDGDEIDHITMGLLKERSSYGAHEAYLLETLKYIISVLKG